NYESDSSSSSIDSAKGSQSDSNNDEPPWKREEDTIILETFQKEDNKEYALQIISHKLPHRTRRDINGRFSKLMALLLETLKQKDKWADPCGTAMLGQPVTEAEQAPNLPSNSKNQFNILAPHAERIRY
ncbi:hypothetical protein GWI33_019989, partial [Rhynchophorus ferrugineus]